MTPPKRPTHRILLISLLPLLSLVLHSTAPAVARAAVAHVSVTAEVVNPAVIDAAKILAAGGQVAQPDRPSAGAQPQVRLTVVDGVPFLTIDYN